MITLLACPQMSALAARIAASHDQIQTVRIRWDTFADGFPNVLVENIESIRNHHLAFLAAFDTPGDIFTQLSAIYEIPRYAVRSFKVVLPYYPTGTMERVDRDGQIATAATLAKMISGVPMTLSGPTQVIIFDIHALQERFYFSDQVIPRLESGVPLLRDRLATLAKPAIAFPDEGAWKRFGRWFEAYPLIVCHKLREGRQRRISIREGDPAGRHVVIVDDLAMSGGTLLECRRALVEQKAAAVSAYVTHGVFPDAAWQPFLTAGFEHFWITDSVPRTAADLQSRPPFEILSLGDTIARLLMEDGQELL
ncbi:MAG: ribose-phosphate diphosphokinase [Desulfobacterales bacterium]|nr:ribose-phosphate diphosphokinase [Desulfobacterales bacterium]MDJ0874108.1 ribose-phosphate diphosphokinase [Desulfobacterales bacterium]